MDVLTGSGGEGAADKPREEQQEEPEFSFSPQGKAANSVALTRQHIIVLRILSACVQLSGSRQDLSTTCLLDDKVASVGPAQPGNKPYFLDVCLLILVMLLLRVDGRVSRISSSLLSFTAPSPGQRPLPPPTPRPRLQPRLPSASLLHRARSRSRVRTAPLLCWTSPWLSHVTSESKHRCYSRIACAVTFTSILAAVTPLGILFSIWRLQSCRSLRSDQTFSSHLHFPARFRVAAMLT